MSTSIQFPRLFLLDYHIRMEYHFQTAFHFYICIHLLIPVNKMANNALASSAPCQMIYLNNAGTLSIERLVTHLNQ